MSPDGSKIYGGTRWNIGVQWDAATGDEDWFVDADGDTQAILLSNGYVYQGFHDGYSRVTRRSACTPSIPPTEPCRPGSGPASSSHPGVWTLDADGRYLVAGGYFANMGGVPVKGLAIFPHRNDRCVLGVYHGGRLIGGSEKRRSVMSGRRAHLEQESARFGSSRP